MIQPRKEKTWAIVGGGLLGMTLSHRLAQHGEDVTLFDGANHLGGLASAWQLGNVVWDRHYHVTLLSDTHLRSLLAELELEKDMRWVETRTGFYTNGQLYSMSNTLEFLRFPPLAMVDKLRLGATIFYASRVKDWRRLERVLVEDWLRLWSGRRTVEKIWLPLLRAKLGDNYQQTSAAFIWATIRRMYAARRTGLKKEMFGYVPGGYARILERFAETIHQEGVKIRLCQAITRVDATSDGKVSLELGAKIRERFDQVLLTVPAPVAAALCPGITREEKTKLEGIQYQGIICASLLLKQPLSQFYVTNITDKGLPFTAVIEMSALVDRKHFGGNALVYLPKYVASDDPAFRMSDDEIRTDFLDGLARMHPQFRPSDVISFCVSRVRYVFPIPTLRYSDNVPAIDTGLPGLHILNSAHIINGTLNVNETVHLAENSVARLLSSANSDTSPAFDLALQFQEG